MSAMQSNMGGALSQEGLYGAAEPQAIVQLSGAGCQKGTSAVASTASHKGGPFLVRFPTILKTRIVSRVQGFQNKVDLRGIEHWD